MAKGIIYIMSTSVDGLIKIGKTNINGFDQRMYNLEHNGYCQVNGLKRQFAIAIENYDEIEKLIHSIFSKSNIPNTELFAVDINLVKQMLSAMSGDIVYPKNQTNADVFAVATDTVGINALSDGDYYMKGKLYHAVLNKSNNKLVLKKGAVLAPVKNIVVKSWLDLRNSLSLVNGATTTDIECSSPSMAATLVGGGQKNGWNYWKTSSGVKIDSFRSNL